MPSGELLSLLMTSPSRSFRERLRENELNELSKKLEESKLLEQLFQAKTAQQALEQSIMEQPGEVKSAHFGGQEAEQAFFKTRAEARLADLKEGVYGKTGEDQAFAELARERGLAREAEANAGLSERKLNVFDRFGIPTARAKLSAEQQLARERGTAAEYNRTRTITNKEQRIRDAQEFERDQQKAKLQAEIDAREDALKQRERQQRLMFNLISPFDLTNERGVSAAISTLQNMEVPEAQVRAFNSNPIKFKEYLYTSLASMQSISQERMQKLSAKGKRSSGEEGSELVDLDSHVYNTAVSNLKLKYANAIFDDPSVVFEKTPKYMEVEGGENVGIERASLITSLASNAAHYGATHSDNTREFYQTSDRYSDLALKYYEQALPMLGGDAMAAMRSIPDSPEKFAAINQQVNNIDIPGTPANQFRQKVARTAGLSNVDTHQQLLEEGLSLGLDPFTISIILKDMTNNRNR